MNRHDLIPARHRAERMFLLDLLGGTVDEAAAAAIDPVAFQEITPKTLYPFVHWKLQQAGVAFSLPQLAESFRENGLRHLRRLAVLRSINETLRASNIPYLLLKGPVLAAKVYPIPATRTMLDVDLLVSDADMPRAMDALAQVGYVVPELFAGHTMQAGDAPPLFNGQHGSPVVELHSMLDSAPDDPAALAAAWESQRVVDLGHGLSVRALGQAEFFAHVVTHVSRHHRFEGELRSMLDVALLVQSDETNFDWHSLRGEWKRRGIDVWVELTLALAKILFGTRIPEAFADAQPAPEVLALAAEQLWVDKDKRISGKITEMLARSQTSPVHAHAQATTVPMPVGLAGVRLRAERQWQRVRRTFLTMRNGTLRPNNVARNVALFRRRERLFALVENSATSARRPR